MTARTRSSGTGRSRSSASCPEACAAFAAIAVVFAASACGGSSNTLAAACRSQTAALGHARSPHDLSTAADTLAAVIRADRSIQRGAGDAELSARARGAAARAAATLAEIRQTDQRALMAPLRTGVPGARRALAEARGLVRDACR